MENIKEELRVGLAKICVSGEKALKEAEEAAGITTQGDQAVRRVALAAAVLVVVVVMAAAAAEAEPQPPVVQAARASAALAIMMTRRGRRMRSRWIWSSSRRAESPQCRRRPCCSA